LNRRQKIAFDELRELLDSRVDRYNGYDFIESDPVSIPHRFSAKEDIEIAGFLAATIAWGTRPGILRSANRLIQLMDEAPCDFILNHEKKDLERFRTFVHRTFNGTDCIFFLTALKEVYRKYGSMEMLFRESNRKGIRSGISTFREAFLQTPHPARSEKHLSDPMKGSSAKRINMFLRWMVRNDNRGVDFGLWRSVSPAILICPLDIHSGSTARKLGLLERKSNDWKAAEELTARLREFDPEDPVKYDFALFGLGVFEGF
jgi:uncharacterized protein (TIGR02757 family)